jgi:mannose-6-phosphate isomerase-like protein (cupin superfamily)
MKDRLPQKIEKPWGFELLFSHTPRYAGKIIFIRKGHRLSLQHHSEKDESMYLYEGKAVIEIEDDDGQLIRSVAQPGYCCRIQPLTKHRLEAIEDTIFFEVSTPELEDVIRFEDDYGRAE